MFPTARLARVDRDTTRRRGSLRNTLLAFSEGKLDILVGTQMLAKGHDFPNLTLVGVVGADAGLSFPDFRSAERTFQLLTQVAGRAGRGDKPGRVVFQSFYPNHYALLFSRKQDYEGFYAKEIEYRRLLGYPPSRNLIQILISVREAAKGRRIGERAAAMIRRVIGEHGLKHKFHVLGPAAAPLEKLRGQYRFQILIKGSPEASAIPILHDSFDRLGAQRFPLKSLHVDVNPLSIL
jgi:primosomal protein N' (replication factor Y)